MCQIEQLQFEALYPKSKHSAKGGNNRPLATTKTNQHSTAEEIAGRGGTYFLPSKLHLNVGVHQVPVLSYEGLLHIRHDAGVHFRESLSAIDLHIKPRPLPLCWDALGEQEVSGNNTKLIQRLWRICGVIDYI